MKRRLLTIIFVLLGIICYVGISIYNREPEFCYVEPTKDLKFSQVMNQVNSKKDCYFSYSFIIEIDGMHATGTEGIYDDYLEYIKKLNELLKNENLHAVKMPDAKNYHSYMIAFMDDVYKHEDYEIRIPFEYDTDNPSNGIFIRPRNIHIAITKNKKCFFIVMDETKDMRGDMYVYYLQNLNTVEEIKELTDDFAKQSKMKFYSMEPLENS